MSGKVNVDTKRRILILFVACVAALLVLCGRLGWIMLVNGEEYSTKAIEQQTKDTTIDASRGIIYDTNMKELAVNAPSYTIWVRPAELKDKKGDVKSMASILSEITGRDAAEIQTELQKDSALVRIAKDLDTEQANKIRTYMSKGELPGISVDESTKRYYPYSTFASHVIGHTSDDNEGIAGLELFYNDYLSGTKGRVIRNTDASGRQISYGTEKYYEAEDGLNLVLTIDEVLQHYLDNALESAYYGTGASRTMAIAMNPDTAEILAMSIFPGYDLNNPRIPTNEKDFEEYNALQSNEDKIAYWNKMWRNSLISDTYEPGSTFKLITTAIALEEGLTNMNETFYCKGYYQLYTDVLKCWRYYNPHGAESLSVAVQNSCNPVFVTLGLRIGAQKYYQYLDNLGFSEKTGVDLPGETSALMYDRNTIKPTELATMSYGQGVSVTPIQLITALSSVVNGGYLRKPHIVKEILDDDGNVIYKNDNKVIRRTVSEQTSAEMREIMESVVAKGTGKAGYIPGYRVGGKTGTADKVINGRYAKGKVYCSFLGIAPSDDPEIIVLFIVDEPAGAVHYASTMAVPYARDFLEDALVYMQVEPKYTSSEAANLSTGTVTVPSLTGYTVEQASAVLSKLGLGTIVMPENSTAAQEVIDQYPKAQTKVNGDSSVYIYTE